MRSRRIFALSIPTAACLARRSLDYARDDAKPGVSAIFNIILHFAFTLKIRVILSGALKMRSRRIYALSVLLCKHSAGRSFDSGLTPSTQDDAGFWNQGDGDFWKNHFAFCTLPFAFTSNPPPLRFLWKMGGYLQNFHEKSANTSCIFPFGLLEYCLALRPKEC